MRHPSTLIWWWSSPRIPVNAETRYISDYLEFVNFILHQFGGKHTIHQSWLRGQIYACTIFRFRSQIEVILLKFYRDSLPCVAILGVAGAIRQPCERFGMEILKNMAMRRIRATPNPATAAAQH